MSPSTISTNTADTGIAQRLATLFKDCPPVEIHPEQKSAYEMSMEAHRRCVESGRTFTKITSDEIAE